MLITKYIHFQPNLNKNLQKVEMSCLFQSLSFFVQNMPHEMIRMAVCDFLMTNPKLMDDMNASDAITHETGMSFENYIKEMRQLSTMGGAIEIRCFTKIFNKNVRVFSVPNKKIIEFIENPNYDFCGLIWTGNHFDPMHNNLPMQNSCEFNNEHTQELC